MMKNFKFAPFFFGLFITLYNTAYGQGDYNFEQIKSISSITGNNNLSINEAEGGVSWSLDLFNIPMTNGEFPISISYSSQGFKVMSEASWIGLDWNLSVDSKIERQLNGLPDELYKPGDITGYWRHNIKPTDSNFSM